MLQHLNDVIEGIVLEHRIRALVFTGYVAGYSTIEEGMGISKRIAELIEQAKKFNERVPSRQIEVSRYESGLAFLDFKLDEEYFAGMPLQ